MKQPILEFIKEGIRVLDGGMGSMMIDAGMPIGQCPETFDADKIRHIQEQYVEAGSDFIISCTFGASPITLKKHGLADQTAEINRRNVGLAREAAGDRAYVLGDIGPCGELLQPFGTLSEDEMIEAFTVQARALDEAGVDGFIIETMTDPKELQGVAKAVRSFSNKPLFASMTFSATPQGFRSVMGTTVEQAVVAMRAAEVDVVGTNCTLAPDEIVELAREFANAQRGPFFVQPNAGRPVPEADRVVYPPIENLEAHIEGMIDAGARLIGGCCGTTPEYIKTVRQIVDRRNAG